MSGLGLRGVMLGSQEKQPKAEKHEGALQAEGAASARREASKDAALELGWIRGRR